MKKWLCLLIACAMMLSYAALAEQDVSVIGQWETEILGHNYLLEFMQDGTLRCYEEDTAQSTQSKRVYKSDPCDVLTYKATGNELSVSLQMVVYPDGNSMNAWRRYDGTYMTGLERYGSSQPTAVGSYPSSLTFKADVPQSSFAGYSSEEPGFSITLNSNFSGDIMEHYMEEVNWFDIQWSCNGNTLVLNSSQDRYTVTFSDGKGIYDNFYGVKVSIDLPSKTEQFFLGTLGYVPDGVSVQMQKTPSPTAEPTAAPTAEPTSEPTAQSEDASLQQTAGNDRTPIEWEGTEWSDAYCEFILNGGYEKAKERFYSDEDWIGPAFCLYDIDLDGTPELVAYNGTYVSADEETYLYGIRDGQVKYLGTVGDNINYVEYLDDNRYPGLFCELGHMGFYYVFYYSLDEYGKVTRQDIVHIEQKGSSYTFEPLTKDETLYSLIMAAIKANTPGQFSVDRINDELRLHGWKPEEIRAMGWGAFVAACPVYAIMTEEPAEETPVEEELENPLILPAAGELINIWESDALPLQWYSVPGATSYDVEIKCAWLAKGGKNKTKTLYRGSFSAGENEIDSIIYQSVSIQDLDLDGVPKTKDLNAWILLTVNR